MIRSAFSLFRNLTYHRMESRTVIRISFRMGYLNPAAVENLVLNSPDRVSLVVKLLDRRFIDSCEEEAFERLVTGRTNVFSD